MIVSTEGHEATGKSTLMFTAPLPLVVFSADMGHDRAIYGVMWQKFFEGLDILKVKYGKAEKGDHKGHDIVIYEMPQSIQLDPKLVMGYMEWWDYFLQKYAEVIQDADVATIGVDTMTLTTKNKRDAYLQELQAKTREGGTPRKQLQQIEYGHPDGEIRSLYQFANAMGKNLVVTHHLREVYGQVMRDGALTTGTTGEWELEGIRDTPKQADIQLRNEKKNNAVSSKFIKCGYNLGLEGSSVPSMTWDVLVDMISIGWHGPEFPRRHPKAIEASGAK